MNDQQDSEDGPPKRPIYFEHNWVLGAFTVAIILALWLIATYVW